MNKVLDNLLVGVALAASLGYAFSSLGPKGLRRRLWAALASAAARAPAALHLGGIARRLDEAAAGKAAVGCGGCGSCSAEPTDSSAKPAAEIRVPLTQIGKRN